MKINKYYSIDFQIENRLVYDHEQLGNIVGRLVQDISIVLKGFLYDDTGISLEELQQKKEESNAFDAFTKQARILLYQYFVKDKNIISIQLYNDIMQFTSSDYESLYTAFVSNNHSAYAKVFQNRMEKAFTDYVMTSLLPNFLYKDVDELKNILYKKYPYCPKEKIELIDNDIIKNVCMLKVVKNEISGFPAIIQQKYANSQKEYPDADSRLILLYEITETIFMDATKESHLVERYTTEWYGGILAMCQEEQTKVFMSKVDTFLTEQKICYGKDPLFDKEIADYYASIITENPGLHTNSSIRARYKSKAFYEDVKNAYMDKARTLLHATLQMDVSLLENIDIYRDIESRVFDKDHYIAYIKEHLKTVIFEFSTKKEQTLAKSVQTNNQKSVVAIITPKKEPASTTDPNLKVKFRTVIGSFKQKTHNKLNKALEDIQEYIWRMYKNDSEVHMKTIQDSLGSLFDNEVVDFVRDLCTELELSIKELDEVLDEAKDIIQSSGNSKPPTIGTESEELSKKTGQIRDNSIPKTLKSIQNKPEELTTDVLIKICKELGYRFWDEKEFSFYANKLGLEKEGKSAIFIKKKLIDYLIKQENDIWIPEGSKETKSYEKLTFHDGSRMVKQKKTMLWLADHETYKKLVQRYFTTQKIDFDKLLEDSEKQDINK